MTCLRYDWLWAGLPGTSTVLCVSCRVQRCYACMLLRSGSVVGCSPCCTSVRPGVLRRTIGIEDIGVQKPLSFHLLPDNNVPAKEVSAVTRERRGQARTLAAIALFTTTGLLAAVHQRIVAWYYPGSTKIKTKMWLEKKNTELIQSKPYCSPKKVLTLPFLIFYIHSFFLNFTKIMNPVA